MGHSIQHYTFNENEDRNHIVAVTNEDAEYNSDNRSGLTSNIRYITNKIYEDKDLAYAGIEKLDNGWYDQLAVKFYDYKKRDETKAIINLREKIKIKEKDLIEYKDKNSIKNRKSQFVGCTKCGSKINKEYLNDYRWNKCPLCGEDLSSETIKKSITNKINQISEMTTLLAEKVKENDKKGKKTIKWLVKTEYHI